MTTRYVAVTVFGVMLAASRVASADATATALDDGGTLSFSELKIHENNGTSADFPSDPEAQWRYFNIAHCQCAAPGVAQDAEYKETQFQQLITTNSTSSSRTVELWAGAACQTDATRAQNCHKIIDVGSVAAIKTDNGVRVDVSVFELMAPVPSATVANCTATSPSQSMDTLFAMVDNNGDSLPDYAPTTQITTDKGPPPLATDFRAVGTEGGIKVSWTAPSDPSDIYRWQALCATADDQPVGKKITALYDTAAQLCGADIMPSLTATEIPASGDDEVDGGTGTVTLPDGMAKLDPKFLCGEDNSPSSTGFTIGGLDNGKSYKVAVLAIDKYGNPTGTYFTRTIAPVPSIDFWEDLHNRNAGVEGGLCLLAETYGDDSSLTGALRSFRDGMLGGSRAGRWLSDAYYATLGKAGGLVHGSMVRRVIAGVLLAPLVAMALLWHWLTLPGVLLLVAALWLARRYRLRWLKAAPALAALLPGLAHAGGYQPYWENPDVMGEKPEVALDDPSLVKWHVGVRVGPFIPEIDAKLGLEKPGPYEQMFGKRFHILVALDVDRVVWNGYGQLAVGLSAGYWQKRARAYDKDSMFKPGDMDRARAGDENTLRLVPTALTATYRFTVLDDDYGIPIVPYVRGGLAYYLWSLTTASGDFGSVCKAGSPEGGCNQDKAYGASLGLQGSIGIAIRAERIDASTAVSMRQSGILHAGIYGELSVAKIDGFGSDKKLSLGDKTWFAGVNFEF